jgi:hypothetical protein
MKENDNAFIFNDKVFLAGIMSNLKAPTNGVKHKIKSIPLLLMKFIS